MANTRPFSVSVVAWLTIICGALGLLQKSSGEQIPSVMVGPVVATLICVVTGVEMLSSVWMLRGSRLARTIYVACLVGMTAFIGIRVLAVGLPSRIVFPVAFTAAMVYFLYRPTASQFFARAKRPQQG
ncbi:hypothetical protein [Paraburkholderia acidisoli]|uniref:DoxX-like protein n=1 Tax=Paraburkholderia acidisoli TaxID=2571748 RepID=A0A7Z2GMQ2_9BURK|nr:hypothetical protein [Paraburkholderia acidisoli]QGZ64622.1 hypothetical protein FAZ98_22560 [Paraburkholderia acidisoli]